MGILDIFSGWKPKDGALYAKHDSVRQKIVGQKEYQITKIIRRTVEITVEGKTYPGSFRTYENDGLCKILIRTDRVHRFLTPIPNVKFDRKVTEETKKTQFYNQQYKYPEINVIYTAEVIDPAKLKDAIYDFEGYSNTEIMRTLFKDRVIRSKEPAFIYEKPPLRSVDFSRIEGMLLGIAIGDSLGNTSESMLLNGNIKLSERYEKFGLITDYLPNKHEHGMKIGLPSDDTQLAFDTLGVILNNRQLNLRELASVFASHRIFGIGGTVKKFLKNYKVYKEPWYYAGVIGGVGNGALMRIEPVIISPLINKDENLYADAVLATMLTHNSALAIGSSVAFVKMLNEFLHCDNPPKDTGFVKRFADDLGAFTGDNEYKWRNEPGVTTPSRKAPELIKQAVEFGLKKGMPTIEFSNYFGSSAYVLETDAAMLYILANYIAEPQEAIIQAVNYTRDNDTIASIVGAAVGALYGKYVFKKSWLDGLSGRTRENDDGKIFEMIGKLKILLNRE